MIEHLIWFSMLSLSFTKKLELIKEYENPENLWSNLVQGNFFDFNFAHLLRSSWNDKKISEIKKNLLDNDIKIVSYNDSLYPIKLKPYEDAPSILFYKGDISWLNAGLSASIVGSRKCTSYGTNAANIISEELSKMGVAIISGMAKGIDTCAHYSCLKSSGFTCAVLGSGLDIIYPKDNKKLFERIASNGCVISEFLPGTQPFSYNFPIRNRIISELSDVVIIIEAGIKSGSLITATFALEKGIDVMAVPGSIFSEQSKGCNKLIKDGAYPLTCMEDIFQLLNIEINIRKKKIKNNFSNELEGKIYNTLNDNPLHIDDIIKLTNIDISNLYEVLFELQLKDEILCLAGNYYVRNMKNI
jgi:DNA processing protein